MPDLIALHFLCVLALQVGDISLNGELLCCRWLFVGTLYLLAGLPPLPVPTSPYKHPLFKRASDSLLCWFGAGVVADFKIPPYVIFVLAPPPPYFAFDIIADFESPSFRTFGFFCEIQIPLFEGAPNSLIGAPLPLVPASTLVPAPP